MIVSYLALVTSDLAQILSLHSTPSSILLSFSTAGEASIVLFDILCSLAFGEKNYATLIENNF